MTRIITELNDCQETPYYVSIIIIWIAVVSKQDPQKNHTEYKIFYALSCGESKVSEWTRIDQMISNMYWDGVFFSLEQLHTIYPQREQGTQRGGQRAVNIHLAKI